MGTRGTKSSAALSVVTPIGESRPQPPDELNAAQAEIWRNVVDRLPAGWFPRETFDVLAGYCRHAATVRFLSSLVDACEAKGTAGLNTDAALADYSKALAMRERESRAMIAAARSLRISKSSQTRAEAASRAARRNPDGQPRPWETPTHKP